MTGIVVVPAGDAIVFATDGAAYDPATGFLIANASKVVLIPECSCVITLRGIGGFARAVHGKLGTLADYDDILSNVVEASEAVSDDYADHSEFDTHWSMTVCGWSNIRERFEINALRSRDYSMRNQVTATSIRFPR